ncbi:hypothetical protein [Tautonia plasticadhaerens]|uniref:Bacterial membrane protein YfhO n=1 Tax=Tautonia plasticadhaerens TaxID=2527974 RepID=A0A518GV89_9BACT|nr:hypothetical protein [Tautonia plasticadhaerens]QDV32494.1 Bacterial membrane protein YfhO [Tautonia plasticadhaerens]
MKSRRLLATALGLGCLAALFLHCFGTALFRGEQFAFRDAGHFYYPLYKVVQDEWAAGRVPLWNPWENGGMPLLGQPTSAALYPGKLLYAGVPYAWGARLYIVAHVLLAVGAMFALMRHWRVSRAGAMIAALGYGFGVPVLFQYCNIIFLVGAAWMPLGLLAVDRLVRLRRRRAIVELAAVLAMQILGGDPQATYVVGLIAAGYAVAIAGDRERVGTPSRRRPLLVTTVIVLGLAAWVGLTIAAGAWLPGLRPEPTQTRPMPVFPWTPYASKALLAAWAVLAVLVAVAWRHSPRGRARMGTLAPLIGSAVVAGLLSAAQLLPSVEFNGLSSRAAQEGSHEIYAFSVEPYRLLELLWPNVFGVSFGVESTWLYTLPPYGSQKVWVPSLYLGGPVIVLAIAGFGLRGGPPGRGLLAAVALIGVLAGLGMYSSPLWYARFVPELAETLGPHDPSMTGPVRLDGELRDGDGGLYWLLSAGLPGFGSFRYPAKFMTFAALGIAGLAGFGWDRLAAGRARPATVTAGAILAITLVSVALLAANSGRFDAFVRSSPMTRQGGTFGPIHVEGARFETTRALLHAAAIMAAMIVLARLTPRRPGLASCAALVLLTADLAVANGRFILTVPQRLLDEGETPRALELIAEAEAEDPADGPYRIHRMPTWTPPSWRLERDPDRVDELIRWERATIQPKYGLLSGVEYTHTEGTAELYDIMFFFAPFQRRLRAEAARVLPYAEPGMDAVIFPRRGFDLWNSRYFVVPRYPDWEDEFRGYASFLPDTTPIYPDPDALDSMSDEGRQRLILEEDFQILRNEDAFPRAWVVHEVRPVEPIEGLDREDRVGRTIELLYPGPGDLFWEDPKLNAYDLTRIAWAEVDPEAPDILRGFVPGGPPSASERVEVVDHRPHRVALRASLDRPGVVVLADTYYPGWRLTIDGEPAPIIRTNHMMRGAAVGSGTHELVYTYEPDSFRLGLIGSAIGLVASLGLLGWSASRPTIGRGSPPPPPSHRP